MRCGSLIYATESGLGILAKSFYDAEVVTDVMVISHGRHPNRLEWYPGSPVCYSLAGDIAALRDFCDSVDVMLFFETPFEWSLISYCKWQKIKTVLMPMHECLHERRFREYPPDLLLCPSLLDMQIEHPNKVFLPVPVNVPWRLRTKAEVFVHNAGHGGLKGRNGTAELMEAIRLCKSEAQFVIRSQSNLGRPEILSPRVRVIQQTVPYDELFADNDVFIFPEKFNGLSLPLQEARAAGMLVMGTDRFPMNEWLPKEPLILVSGTQTNRIGPPYREFVEEVISPCDIAAKIDEWYGRDITEYSLQGKVWAESMSWENLKPEYMKVLEELCE